MALRFEGDRVFVLPPEQVWPKLRDARFLIHGIPGAMVRGEPERDRAQCVVTPELSFARGQMEVTVQILGGDEPKSLRFALQSKGVGSTNQVEIGLALEPHEGGTKIHWVAEVTQLGGLLKLVPSGLIRGAAQKVIEDVWNGIEKQMTAS